MNTSAELVVGIFIILDRINPDFDTKQVWNNLKQKSGDELNEVYSELSKTESK